MSRFWFFNFIFWFWGSRWIWYIAIKSWTTRKKCRRATKKNLLFLSLLSLYTKKNVAFIPFKVPKWKWIFFFKAGKWNLCHGKKKNGHCLKPGFHVSEWRVNDSVDCYSLFQWTYIRRGKESFKFKVEMVEMRNEKIDAWKMISCSRCSQGKIRLVNCSTWQCLCERSISSGDVNIKILRWLELRRQRKINRRK